MGEAVVNRVVVHLAERLRQEDHELEGGLGYTVTCLKK
jgi:hypothetical protein